MRVNKLCMSVIDNTSQTMLSALQNALSTSDSIDIAVGYFFFSGFQALAHELENKKIRILVGLEIDQSLIAQITQLAREGDVDLSKWQPRTPTLSKMQLRSNYIDALVGFINDSDIFDDDKSNEVFDLFMKKIENGTLEIRKTQEDYHGKFYLIKNNKESSQNGDFPGTLFIGSSNLTYRGLVGQGELNDSFRDRYKFEEYQKEFDALWEDSRSISIADQNTSEDFIRTLKPKVWKYATPTPYHIYLRILHELFESEQNESVLSPGRITGGQFADLEYQVDAIKAVIDRLDRYDGAILADVVGLGKSVIASAVAKNINIKTVIIAPPHLVSQWEDYKESFKIVGSKVFSAGKIIDVYERYRESSEPILFVIDEAHRFRNEDTTDYKMLHQVSRSHPDNKVLLLTATPFNNAPQDVFALVKLFQVPGQATIRSIDNLSLRYRDLIARYKQLRRSMRKTKDLELEEELEEIAQEQRRLIEPVVIRRSRLDLRNITRYREDLARQNIDFAAIEGPDLLEYHLGDLEPLYVSTLELLTKEDKLGFIGARYKPTTAEYMSPESQQKFFEKYKSEYGDIEDLRIAQTNLSKFMKRLLVMRFESSKNAFKSTLLKMIKSNEVIEAWYEKVGKVPIMKKGDLPDPTDYDFVDGEEDTSFDTELENLRSKPGYIEIDISLLEPVFIEDLRHDTQLLKQIYQDWFSDSVLGDLDPKLDETVRQIKAQLESNPDKKIVIFSAYKDTVEYLYDQIVARGITRITKYTAADGNESYKKVIKANFDASYASSLQVNDFDVLVATDALSEGFNLHRAGIIINYDIPYNPTRVIQRVGRINRINKKMFETLKIFNCFPTFIGDEEVRVRSISTLKIRLINSVVGSDTRTLTPDEDLVSYFKDEFNRAQKESESLSWDTIHREVYEKAKSDLNTMKVVTSLPRRSRILRKDQKRVGVIVYGKKGPNSIFTYQSVDGSNPEIISAERALPLFSANVEENASEVGDNFTDMFKLAKEKLFEKHELPKMQGRRGEALKFLEVLSQLLPAAKLYCDDIVKIIKEYDDVNDGALKDIAQIKLGKDNLKMAYESLQEIVPQSHITNVFNKVKKEQSDQELLLFAEQLV